MQARQALERFAQLDRWTDEVFAKNVKQRVFVPSQETGLSTRVLFQQS